jgi:PncC family amidohydrolase
MTEQVEYRVHELMTKKGLTLAVGESCTGGLLGHRITNVAGSSTYFLGGAIAYAYDAKERLLDVDHLTLYEHGAVSEETALEMARGARQALRADIGVSITGISGPSGGLPDKPVGLTWVAVSTRSGEWTSEHIWDGDRYENKEASVDAALELLNEVLEKE